MTRPKDNLTVSVAHAAAAGAILFALIGAPAIAQEANANAQTYAVMVRGLDLHPRSPAAAQRTLNRLGEAALEACGGSEFSLFEVKRTIRASSCWRTAMADVLRRVGDSVLAQTYANELRPNG